MKSSEWRLITADGKNMREYREVTILKSRLRHVCPNNPGYRQYVKGLSDGDEYDVRL